jgi:hypothetical protein
MPENDGGKDSRLNSLQERINSALRESGEEHIRSRFSFYAQDVSEPDPANELMRAASAGGFEGVEAALDKFESLIEKKGEGAMRNALMSFLAHNPDIRKLGLRIPSIEERSAWKLASSDKMPPPEENS